MGFFITLRFIQNDSPPHVNSSGVQKFGTERRILNSIAALDGIASPPQAGRNDRTGNHIN